MNTSITIAGNVTRDPELRFTASGVPTTSFSVVVNRRVNTRNDSAPTEVVSFFTVVAWNAMAENACLSLTKGSRVVISGRLEQRSWQTAAGEKRTVYELVADEIGASLRFASAAIERNQRVSPTIDDLRAAVFGIPDPAAPNYGSEFDAQFAQSNGGGEREDVENANGLHSADLNKHDGDSRSDELVGAGAPWSGGGPSLTDDPFDA